MAFGAVLDYLSIHLVGDLGSACIEILLGMIAFRCFPSLTRKFIFSYLALLLIGLLPLNLYGLIVSISLLGSTFTFFLYQGRFEKK